ncbi:ankyrin repeat and SOCS box protein 13 isoform X2 [Ahaetulla prasina]|uniref:ankyrin repeat and SOCS box protein 13 isoform X2 n=1 Tax=Ahaetulla prasina TaxID=499056 RepID=UPI0026487A42|nr:ankyrin repeat and SOCS box protein 13 isoform X2 [Ahaetulla prasina]
MEPVTAGGSFLGEIAFWAERTPVHEAARGGEVCQLQELIKNGACVNLVTYDSITPLHEASLRGQTRCVEILLAAGAQVDARNIDGSTPLCDACASGSIECVKVLLSHGAKVNPLLYIASPLHEACLNGANVNAAKLHETALHHAAKVRNADLAEMLIEFGGNVYARDNRGKKPSDYSQRNSSTAKCFAYYERNPLRLSQLCRLSLRHALGQKALEKIPHLHIPTKFVEFLSYRQ